MTESERLKCVIEYYKMSTNKFAEYIGLKSAQNLYDVLKGRNGISKNLSEKIKALCVNVNISWLLTGEGEMLKNSLQENEAPKHKEKVTNTITIPQDIWEVIKSQSESLKLQSESLKNRDSQMDELIGMLKQQILESKKTDVQRGCDAANAAAI